MKTEDRHTFRAPENLTVCPCKNNSSVLPARKPLMLHLLGYISDFLSTQRIKAEKTTALLIIAEGTPHSPLPIKQPVSIKHHQQLPGH